MFADSSWTGEGLVHEVCLYESDADLRARVVPFVEEGLAAQQPVFVVAGARVHAMLHDRLGARVADLALLADADETWVGAAQTMAFYRDALRQRLQAGTPCRLLSEPTWMAQGWGAAWSRYDAVANELLAGQPCWTLCLHDRHQVPQPLLDSALRVHPYVWDGSRTAPSPHYRPTEEFLRSVEPPWSPPPATRDSQVVSAPAEARSIVASTLPAPAEEALRDDVTLAVNELVANAITAAGTAEVSHWRQGDAMVWEVSDAGAGMHAATAGYVPPPADQLSGRGLWIARTLADEAVVRSWGPGTAIRLFFPAS
jgi:anti-sigma regulatory factor (Ser/Thr protein kinase)